jgi:hypothetical protein
MPMGGPEVTEYVAPQLHVQAFTCPHCGAFAQQSWTALPAGSTMTSNVLRSRCQFCSKIALWYLERMVYPAVSIGPLPHEDMPTTVRDLFLEARDVGARSPRAAAALLRLSLQILIQDLTPQAGGNLNTGIASLVADGGLHPQVRQAMDVVRVVGNNAVHPGELQMDEDSDLVPALFGLINLVVEQVISRPKQVSDLFSSLPAGALEQIRRRDEGSGK